MTAPTDPVLAMLEAADNAPWTVTFMGKRGSMIRDAGGNFVADAYAPCAPVILRAVNGAWGAMEALRAVIEDHRKGCQGTRHLDTLDAVRAALAALEGTP